MSSTSSVASHHGRFGLYGRLLSHIRPYTRAFIISILGMIAVAAADSGFVMLLKPIMDRGFIGREQDFIEIMPFLLIGVFLLRGIAIFADNYGMAWVARKTIADIRLAMFRRMLQMPAPWYDTMPSGELIARVINHVESISSACTAAVRTAVRDVLTVIFLLAWMTWINVYLTLVFLTVSPLLAIVVRVASARFRSITHDVQNSVSRMTEIAREVFNFHRLVKSTNSYAHEGERFAAAVRFNTRTNLKREAAISISVSLLMTVVGCGLAAVLALSTWFSGLQELSAGSFTSYLAAISMLVPPVRRLAAVNASIQTGLAAAESVFEILDSVPERDRGTRILDSAQGHIVFENVNFRYGDGPLVLDDVCFEVAVGSTVALVGVTGSGKSTIVDLLLRLYQPSQGRILLDGVPIEELQLHHLRSQLAVVQQDSDLVNDSIAANIAYGITDELRDEERINKAARGARVLEFANRLPHGLQTTVGEDGTFLSGGQRQRVCIARALYRDAPLLILDEATSSLDNRSEVLIQEAMDELRRGRTTFVIAHRLSTIENADHIVVLEQGRIAERGVHAELMAKGGIYSVLYRANRRVVTKVATNGVS